MYCESVYYVAVGHYSLTYRLLCIRNMTEERKEPPSKPPPPNPKKFRTLLLMKANELQRGELQQHSFYIQEVCCETKRNFTQERSGSAALPGRVLAEIPGTGSYPGGVTD